MQLIASSLFRVDLDHLSRIKLGVAKSLVFFNGNRAAQTALARLRFDIVAWLHQHRGGRRWLQEFVNSLNS